MSSSAPIPPERITYTDNDMENVVKTFKAKKIPVYEPGEDNHERYIATSNLIYRFSSPPCVVQPKCACDVRDVIRIAKSRNIPITIKNGGHSYAGASTTNVGILMELGLMNEVDLDRESETVTVQGGALWFHVYKKLVSLHLDGFIANGGRCPTVGVSGFILGGGLAPFTRSFGMGSDTLKEISIVTAEGDEVTVSERDDPKSKNGKLFWALRGAGGGNFGVVVKMKLALNRLKSDVVVAGRYTFYPTSVDGFMTTMNSFYTRNWPDEMTIDSSWLCDLEKKEPELGVRFLVYYNGGRKDFNKAIDDWTLPNAPDEHEELKKQLKRRSIQEKSSRFLHETLAAQWVEETKKSFPTNRSYQIYTSFMFKNDRKDMEKLTRIIRDEMKAFRDQFPGETGLLQVTFIHSGGAANKKQRRDTAFRWRGCIYFVYIMIQWNDKWLEMNMRGFLERMKPKLSQFGMVKGATFINFADDSLKEDAHEKSYYGNNHQELRRIKKTWDKDNFFSWSQGIRVQKTDASPPSNIINEEDHDLVKDLRDAKGFVVNEESLTDALAEQQWESYRPTSTEVYGNEALPALVY
jgi:FAD binding domain/Berberine and berberine like